MINKKVYCPKDSDFTSYYSNQSGSGFGDIRIVRAPRYQRGYGLGSFFSRLAMPLIKHLGSDLLEKGATVGKRVVSDPQIQAALKNSLSEIAAKSLAKIREPNQSGSGRRLYKKKMTTRRTTKRKVSRDPKDIFRV